MSQPDPQTHTDAADEVRCHVRRFEIRAEVESLLTLDLAALARRWELPTTGTRRLTP